MVRERYTMVTLIKRKQKRYLSFTEWTSKQGKLTNKEGHYIVIKGQFSKET